MSRGDVGLTPQEARARNDEAKFRERVEAVKCRQAFLRKGHDHECTQTPPCSRDYDPTPTSGCEPWPYEDYVGTGVGALYGGPMNARQVLELAGWNVRPGAESEEVGSGDQ